MPVRLLLCLALSLPGLTQAGTPPIAVEVNVPQTTLTVGQPLVIELRVTNIGDAALGWFDVYSSDFSLTYYQGDIVEDCVVHIALPELVEPFPPRPPLFLFAWEVDGLQPGESATCRITYTQTLFPGTEKITLSSAIAGNSWPDLAEFTYTLLPQGEPQPPRPPPQPVPLWSPVGLLVITVTLVLLGWHQLHTRRALAKKHVESQETPD